MQPIPTNTVLDTIKLSVLGNYQINQLILVMICKRMRKNCFKDSTL